MLFNSTRAGGQGSADIWVMTRADATAPFSPARPLASVNSPQWEGDLYLTPDGRTLYFSSDRPGGKGRTDLYRSESVRVP